MKPRKNISLIIGLSIPVLMIVLVAASIYLPGLFAPSPHVNFLYVIGDHDYYAGQEYVVEQGRLAKQVVNIEVKNYPERYTPPSVSRLFVHDVAMNRSKQISFEEAQGLPLDPSVQSPDGFEVVHGSRGDGLYPFFFDHSVDYNTWYLKGHNVSKKLNVEALEDRSYYFRRIRFLGWIGEKQ